ncbi:MAG: insulinase family protein [Deltaproteobacteria bacterium]|nr:insulinase family protein [Deltaproteobacteria bacterium]
MRVLIEPSSALPLCSVQLVLEGGAAHDPADKLGLGQVAAELMRRGAGGRTRAELDAAFDALGASFEIDVDHDHVSMGGMVLEQHLGAYLALLGDVLAAPALDPRELRELLREARGALDELRDDDRALVRRFHDRALWGDHPYGRPAGGTRTSLGALTLADVQGWVKRWVVADNLVVGFAGAVGKRAERLAEPLLARLPTRAAPRARLARPAGMAGATHGRRRLVLVDKPARTQSQILMGHPGPLWKTPDFLPLEVAMTAFGGTFTARLMTEVRVKRGWSYGARAYLSRGRAGAFSMHVFPSAEQTPDTIALVHRMFAELCDGGLSDDEVAFAQRYLERGFAFEIDTPERRLHVRLSTLLAGLPDDYIQTYRKRVRAVRPADIRRAMKRHLDPGQLLTTLVATRTIAKRLPKTAGKIEIQRFDSY